MSKRILFPEAKKFSDIFIATEWATNSTRTLEPCKFQVPDWFGAVNSKTRSGMRKHRKVTVEVGPCCGGVLRQGTSELARGEFAHLYVKASKEVEEAIERNWVGDSPGHYKIVIRYDGTALLLAEYDRILGSHWLALVDASTVPEGD